MSEEKSNFHNMAQSLVKVRATECSQDFTRAWFFKEIYFLSDVARTFRMTAATAKEALKALKISHLDISTNRPRYSGCSVRTLGGQAPETASPLLRRRDCLVVLGMEPKEISTLVRQIRAGAFPEYEIIPGVFRYRREDVDLYAASLAKPALMTLEEVAGFWGVTQETASRALSVLGISPVEWLRFPAEAIRSLGGTVEPTQAPFLRRRDVAIVASLNPATLERRIAAGLLPQCVLLPRTYLYRVEDVATFIAAETLLRDHERDAMEKMLMTQQMLRLSGIDPRSNITPPKQSGTTFSRRNVRWVDKT